jgi:hypothetical protein
MKSSAMATIHLPPRWLSSAYSGDLRVPLMAEDSSRLLIADDNKVNRLLA